MNSTTFALAAVSLAFAGWMLYLYGRASEAALSRSGPGIRVPAAKVCEHTWRAAQRAGAPSYRKLAVLLVILAALTVGLDVAGVDEQAVTITWFIAAVGAQVVLLAGAGNAATDAAKAVRCEHQAAVETPRSGRPTASRRTGARAKGRGNKRRKTKGQRGGRR